MPRSEGETAKTRNFSARVCARLVDIRPDGEPRTRPGPMSDPRVAAIPDTHGHAKGEHKPYVEERPIPYSARMLFLWFYHAAVRGRPRFMMVADHINYLTFEDPAAVNLVRRALKLAAAGDLYGAAETAGVELGHAQAVSDALRRGMRFSIGAELDNDPRARPDAQNIVEAMKPDGLIRSIHFLTIEHPVHGAGWLWPFDNPEFSSLYDTLGTDRVWELYMASLLEAVEKLPGHIVGHFYVPAKFGHWPAQSTLEAYEDKLLDAVAARGMAVELNMRFYYRYFDDEDQRRKYLEANRRLLRKAKAKDVPIAVGSDAHSPKDQGAVFEHVLEMLDEAEINELVFPVAGRLARVALRVVREEPPPEPAVEEVAPEAERAAAAKAQEEPVAAKAASRPTRVRPSRARAPGTGAARTTKPPAKETPAPTATPARAKAAAKEPAKKEPAKKESVKSAPAKPKATTESKPAAKPARAAKPAPTPARSAARKAAPVHAKPAKKAPPAPKRAPVRAAAKPARTAKPATKPKAHKAPAKATKPVKPAKAAAVKRIKPVAAKPVARRATTVKKAAPKKRPAKGRR
jgi:HisJ family histidinol phosphate phosphatase